MRAARGEGGRVANERGLAVGGRLVPRDESSLLAALASWRFLTVRQLGALLGLSELVVYRRLRVLRAHGLVDYARPFQREPGVFLITAAGLAPLRSELPAPRLDLRTYRHKLWKDFERLRRRAEKRGMIQRATLVFEDAPRPMLICAAVVPSSERRALSTALEALVAQRLDELGDQPVLGIGAVAASARPYDALLVVDHARWSTPS